MYLVFEWIITDSQQTNSVSRLKPVNNSFVNQQKTFTVWHQ